MDLFIPIRFRSSIQLTPSELSVDFQSVLQKKLQNNLEGVCSRFGYIRPGSIEIMRRSAGQFVKQHFNGHIRFDVVCKAEVCNPPQGTILKALVRNKNAMGLLAESMVRMGDEDIPVLDVIIPKRAAGISSDLDLDRVQIGDEIYIAVQGKRYQLNDKKISVIGKAVPKPDEIKPIVTAIDETNSIEVRDEDIFEEDDAEDVTEEEDDTNVSDDEFNEDGTKVVKKKVIDIEDEEVIGGTLDEEDVDFYADGDVSGSEFDEEEATVTGGYEDDYI